MYTLIYFNKINYMNDLLSFLQSVSISLQDMAVLQYPTLEINPLKSFSLSPINIFLLQIKGIDGIRMCFIIFPSIQILAYLPLSMITIWFHFCSFSALIEMLCIAISLFSSRYEISIISVLLQGIYFIFGEPYLFIIFFLYL